MNRDFVYVPLGAIVAGWNKWLAVNDVQSLLALYVTFITATILSIRLYSLLMGNKKKGKQNEDENNDSLV